MTSPKTLVVLAAGIGSRYGGLKQVEPVGPGGEMIIDYSIFDALHAGFTKVVFVITRAIEKDFHEAVGDRIAAHVATEYVFQGLDLPSRAAPRGRKKPWGTAHATLVCADAVDTPFAVINADDFYGRESFKAVANFLDETYEEPDTYAMAGYILRNTVSEHGSVARGICRVAEGGLLEHIEERTSIVVEDGRIRCDDHEYSGDELVSMNLWAFKPSLFQHLAEGFKAFLEENIDDPKKEFFLPFLVNELLQAGRIGVRVLPTESSWFGVTYPGDKEVVVREIRSLADADVYPPQLWGSP